MVLVSGRWLNGAVNNSAVISEERISQVGICALCFIKCSDTVDLVPRKASSSLQVMFRNVLIGAVSMCET